MQADTGQICYKNVTSLSAHLGIDYRSLTKMLQKCIDHVRIEPLSENKFANFEIVNYEYWQGLKDFKDWKNNTNMLAKMSPKQHKSRTKQSNIEPIVKEDKIVKEITDYFCDMFLEHTGNEYDFQKKDGVLFAGLFKKYGVEKTKQIICMFFNSDDSFIIDAGYTVGVLKSQINKLLSKEYRSLDSLSKQHPELWEGYRLLKPPRPAFAEYVKQKKEIKNERNKV